MHADCFRTGRRWDCGREKESQACILFSHMQLLYLLVIRLAIDDVARAYSQQLATLLIMLQGHTGPAKRGYSPGKMFPNDLAQTMTQVFASSMIVAATLVGREALLWIYIQFEKTK